MNPHPNAGECNGEGCHFCYLIATREDYREAWGTSIGEKPSKMKYCLHLGPFTGERRKCPPCEGNVQLSIYSCGLHELCTLGKPLDGVKCCKTCTDNTEIER